VALIGTRLIPAEEEEKKKEDNEIDGGWMEDKPTGQKID
jgi:hypothetical protein